MSYKHWQLDKDNEGLLWLTLNREGTPVNSLSRDVFSELNDILTAVANEPPAGMAIISGKKTGFIAGADISQFTALKTADEAFDLIRQGQVILDKLAALPFPTVACIHGFCLGGGTELALACTYRLATDDPSTKIGLPEVKLGIHPGWGGTVRLPLLIGAPKAMNVMLTGASFSGKAMAKMGVVDACVPLRELKRAAHYYLTHKPARHTPKWHEALTNSSLLRSFIGNFFYGALKKKKVVKDHYPAPYAIVRNWVRDGARGVGLEDLFELALGFLVPEVVDESDAAIEACLLGRRAGDGEGDLAKALGGLGQGRENGRKREQQQGGVALHKSDCSDFRNDRWPWL